MTAVELKPVGFDQDGNQLVRATLLANEAPDPLPVNGADVIGMNEKQRFAPMSTLFVLAADTEKKLFIADENGRFIAQ